MLEGIYGVGRVTISCVDNMALSVNVLSYQTVRAYFCILEGFVNIASPFHIIQNPCIPKHVSQ